MIWRKNVESNKKPKQKGHTSNGLFWQYVWIFRVNQVLFVCPIWMIAILWMLCAILACASYLIDLDIALDNKNVYFFKPNWQFLKKIHLENIVLVTIGCVSMRLSMITKLMGQLMRYLCYHLCYYVGSKCSDEPAQMCSFARAFVAWSH